MLKKLGIIGAFVFCATAVPNLFAQACCPADCPAGDCYCRYVHYEPKCTYSKRCYEEQIPCPRKCCRFVPEYYEVQRCKYRTEQYCVPVQQCRYVPDYYTTYVTKCRKVPEYYCEKKCRCVPQYYEVQDCKTCKRYVCEPNYTCVPRYYWKYECRN